MFLESNLARRDLSCHVTVISNMRKNQFMKRLTGQVSSDKLTFQEVFSPSVKRAVHIQSQYGPFVSERWKGSPKAVLCVIMSV